VAWFCIAVFDGAEAEKAGDNGIPSASVTAIAIETCFVDVNILNSILKLCGFQALVATGMQLVRTRGGSSAWCGAGSSATDQTCWRTVKVKSGYQLFVKRVVGHAERLDRDGGLLTDGRIFGKKGR